MILLKNREKKEIERELEDVDRLASIRVTTKKGFSKG